MSDSSSPSAESATVDRPFLIGVAGGSSSGKTTISERLVDLTGEEHLSRIELDSYYLDRSHEPLETRSAANYDHPDAFDWPLLNDHMAALANGASVEVPIYDYAEHNRSGHTRTVHPKKIIVVDGILVLWDRYCASDSTSRSSSIPRPTSASFGASLATSPIAAVPPRASSISTSKPFGPLTSDSSNQANGTPT